VLVVTDADGRVVGPFSANATSGSLIVVDSNGAVLALPLVADASSLPATYGFASIAGQGIEVFHASLDCSGPRLTQMSPATVFNTPVVQTSSGIYYVDPTSTQHLPQSGPASVEDISGTQAFELPGQCNPLPVELIPSDLIFGAIIKINPASVTSTPPFYIQIR
jgi:hypothetical protein